MTDDRALELAEAALHEWRHRVMSGEGLDEIKQALFVIAGLRTYLAANPSPSPAEAKREAYLGQPTAEHPEGLRTTQRSPRPFTTPETPWCNCGAKTTQPEGHEWDCPARHNR